MPRLVPKSGHCELDGFPLTIAIGNYGQTLVSCPGCTRRRARLCMECGRPVVGRAWRCTAHLRAWRRMTDRRHDKRNRDERRRKERQRWKRLPKAKRAAKNATKKLWRVAHPDRVKAWKEQGRLDGTYGYASREKYLEAQAKQNVRRAERKRQQMRELALLRSPWRDKEPTCKECGVVIEWNRIGRPRRRCLACQPARVAA